MANVRVVIGYVKCLYLCPLGSIGGPFLMARSAGCWGLVGLLKDAVFDTVGFWRSRTGGPLSSLVMAMLCLVPFLLG